MFCAASEYHRRESRFAPELQTTLERIYGHLAAGVSFESPLEIEQQQLLDGLDAWLADHPARPVTLDVDRVLRGDLTGWSDLLRIQTSMAWPPEWTDTERNERHARHSEFVDRVFASWATDRDRSFQEVFEHEVAAFGRTIVNENVRYHFVRPQISDPIRLLNLDHAPPILLMKAVCAHLSRAGVPDQDVWIKATEFFGSPALRTPGPRRWQHEACDACKEKPVHVGPFWRGVCAGEADREITRAIV